MSDQDLVDHKNIFQKEVSTSSGLTWAVDMSKNLLQMYEFAMVNMLDINISGVSKLGDNPEYNQCVRSFLMKYMNTSLVSQIEPEYKLMYMLLSTSLICHQINTSEVTQQKTQHIEQQINDPKLHEPENDIVKVITMRNLNQEYSDL
jgi:hypothetical protein